MYNATPYDNYLETEVMTADPIRLVQLLYQGALSAIADARQFLQAGDIAARTRSLNKAIDILQELTGSLNFEAGGELSRNLAELYAYCQSRLLDANVRQADQPMAEVQRLLGLLADAWIACSVDLVSEPA